jgi:CubicO group peptidase (beta-lactamase class C family)
VQILNGTAPATTAPVRLERSPATGFEYSNGAVLVQQLALMDAVGRPFEQIAREWIFEPLRMTSSTFETTLSPDLQKRAARGHTPRGVRFDTPWRVYPEQAAGGLWTTAADLAQFVIEVQLSISGRSNRVIAQSLAREMVLPVGIGPYAIGFQIAQQGEGWYFMHGGDNEGFQADLIAHQTKGYGAVIMTNGANGVALIPQLRRLIQQEYRWDALGSER